MHIPEKRLKFENVFRNRKKIREISCPHSPSLSLLGENLHRKQKEGSFPSSRFSPIRMRSRYPPFIPLTLSTSVAFQFRTCRAVSLNNFRRSQEHRSRWKFHRWGESSGFKIPPSSRLPYFSYVYLASFDRPSPSSPECLTRIDSFRPLLQRMREKPLNYLYFSSGGGSKVNLQG